MVLPFSVSYDQASAAGCPSMTEKADALAQSREDLLRNDTPRRDLFAVYVDYDLV